MDYLTLSYAIYGTAAVVLTATLARILGRNGAIFLDEVFEDRPGMAEAVNRLLVIGFYMLNLGYALLIFRAENAATNVEITENLITRLGLLLVSLGVIHFVNMAVFFKVQRRAGRNQRVPVFPQAMVPPPPTGGFQVQGGNQYWTDQGTPAAQPGQPQPAATTPA